MAVIVKKAVRREPNRIGFLNRLKKRHAKPVYLCAGFRHLESNGPFFRSGKWFIADGYDFKLIFTTLSQNHHLEMTCSVEGFFSESDLNRGSDWL
jgi:hypothetical protein